MSESFTRELKRVLRDNACHFDRQGKGDHEIWFSPITNHYFVVDQQIKSRHTRQRGPQTSRYLQEVLDSRGTATILHPTVAGRLIKGLSSDDADTTQRGDGFICADLRHLRMILVVGWIRGG